MSDPEKPRDELEGTEAPFVSHLVELRDRLIRALIAVGMRPTLSRSTNSPVPTAR